MNPRTKGTIACVAVAAILGGIIGYNVFDELLARLFFIGYFAVLGLCTGVVISLDNRDEMKNDYFSYLLFGSLTFATLEMIVTCMNRGELPEFSPFMITFLFVLGLFQGLAYRIAALWGLKNASKNL